MPRPMPCASPCGAGGSRMASKCSPRMGALSTRRSQEAKLPTASGATPVLTRAAPSPGFCRCGRASASAFGATRRACSGSFCPRQPLALLCRTAARSSYFPSLPSLPSWMDAHLETCLVTASGTAQGAAQRQPIREQEQGTAPRTSQPASSARGQRASARSSMCTPKH